jgi:UDP-N-acetylglucosamine---dolichyl-phosphate N-acetylglucosaminyltransferase
MDRRFPSISIVIPAHNEEQAISHVIKETKAAGYDTIIVIDDGSTDQTEAAAKRSGATVFRHLINRGKGAAIKTGIDAAKRLGADIIVTIDGDGQHDPTDIAPMIKAISQDGYDVVLGNRLQDRSGMPAYKIIHNLIGNFIVWLLYGLWVNDSQSGFRAYSKKAAHAIDTHTDRYEYDSEVIREIHHNHLRFIELPIKVRYTAYSLGKRQKMNLKNGCKTLIRMLIFE